MKFAILIIVAVFSSLLTGCGKSEPEKVSFNTLEDARAQVRANAEFNATAYRAENPRLAGMKIVGHGDSTQAPDCPQGDGWASLSLMNVNKDATTNQTQAVEKVKIKCSTVSVSLGCYTEADFTGKPFAKQENRCDTSLPFPLPKLGK